MSEPQSLVLTEASPTLRREQALFGQARVLTWPTPPTRLHLERVTELAAAAAGCNLWCRWEAGAWQGYCGWAAENLAKLAPEDLRTFLDPHPPADLDDFVWPTILAPWLESLEAQLGRPVRLSAWSKTPPNPQPEGLQVRASLTPGGELGCLLLLNDQAWKALTENWPYVAAVTEGASTDGLPFPLVLELGRRTLPASAWRGLATGDLVLLDCQPGATEPNYRLRVGHNRYFGAKATGQKIELLAPMAAETSPTPARAGDNWADDLPVQVIFEAGRLELPLKELRSVQAGYCFELPRPPGATVALVANGVTIGEGELVRLGDVLGVKVVRLKLP
jgi:type III secretion protein Q